MTLGTQPRIHHEDVDVRVHRTIDRSLDIFGASKGEYERERGMAQRREGGRMRGERCTERKSDQGRGEKEQK